MLKEINKQHCKTQYQLQADFGSGWMIMGNDINNLKKALKKKKECENNKNVSMKTRLIETKTSIIW